MNTAGGRAGAGEGWTLVVPVKSLDLAKSRLSSTLSPQSRRQLVLAMATDVITACLQSPHVARVRVVSVDPHVAELATALGAESVTEPADAPGSTPIAPRPPRTPIPDGRDANPPRALAADESSLNSALAGALSGIPGPAGVVTADLPELDAALLTRILDSASLHTHSVVTDHRGEGTTMAFWTGPSDRVCRFGPDSAARFRTEGGAAAIPRADSGWDAASRDVDVPGDLTRLLRRRVGIATSRLLEGGTTPLACTIGAESATMVR